MPATRERQRGNRPRSGRFEPDAIQSPTASSYPVCRGDLARRARGGERRAGDDERREPGHVESVGQRRAVVAKRRQPAQRPGPNRRACRPRRAGTSCQATRRPPRGPAPSGAARPPPASHSPRRTAPAPDAGERRNRRPIASVCPVSAVAANVSRPATSCTAVAAIAVVANAPTTSVRRPTGVARMV